jgi:hypothetical protein
MFLKFFYSGDSRRIKLQYKGKTYEGYRLNELPKTFKTSNSDFFTCQGLTFVVE